MHMYQYLEQTFKPDLDPGPQSDLYALLSRMEQAGLVTHERQGPGKKAGPKNFFPYPGRKKNIQPLG